MNMTSCLYSRNLGDPPRAFSLYLMVESLSVRRDATVMCVSKSSRTVVSCLPQLASASLFVVGMCSPGGMDSNAAAKFSMVGKDSAESWTRL